MTQKFPVAPLVGGVPMMKGSNLGGSKHCLIDPMCRPNRYGAGDHVPNGGIGVTEHNAYAQSSGANGDWWEYDVVLPASPAGQRWAGWFYSWRAPTDGICRITVNGVLQADADFYVASGATDYLYGFFMNRTAGDQNFITTRPEKVVLRLEAFGKNAASSGYRFVFTGLQFFTLF